MFCASVGRHPTALLIAVAGLSCLALPSAVRADWSSTSSSQLVLRVEAASGTAAAAGANYAIQGSGLASIPALNDGVAPAADLVLAPVSDGATFLVNMSYKPADQLTPVSLDGSLPAYSELSLDQGGSAGGLAGEINSPLSGSATPGGPGTTATLTQSNTFSVFN